MKTSTVRNLVCAVCLAAALATASAQSDRGSASTQKDSRAATAQTNQRAARKKRRATASAQVDQGSASSQADQATATAQTNQGSASAQTGQGQRQVGEVPVGPPTTPQAPQRPQYLDLPYQEDWSHIREVPGPADFWDPIKYIPLDHPGWYMSLGGEIRERYDNWDNANFGYSPAKSLNSSLQRYLFHDDMHFGEHLRVFLQTQSALEFGQKGGPFYSDKNTFEIHQGFLDWRSSEDPKHYWRLRVGLQEIALGADHFISTGDFFNARRNFLGATLKIGTGSWTWFAQATKPMVIKIGAFDDAPEHATSWGGGVFAPNPFSKQGRTSFFYTALDTQRQLWQRGLGRDFRHTLGARIEGTRKGWDYTYETLGQVGTFTPVQGPGVGIRAWAITTDDGYTLQRARRFFSYPRIGLSTSFTSGDSGHGSLGTFHPLFPDHAYSGEMGMVGPSNGYQLTPTFRFALTRRIYETGEWSWMWRQSIHDAIYAPAILTVPVDSGIIGFIEKPGNLSNARYIGNQAGIATAINIDRHLTYIVGYSYFTPGPFVLETPPGKPTGLFVTFFNYVF